MKTLRIYLVFLCLLGLGTPRLEAGVFVGGRLSAAGQAGEMTMRLEGALARVEMETSGVGAGATFIFRGDRNLAWLIDDEVKTATEIGPADIVRIAAMLKALEEQLKALPPEQRAMAEAMIGQVLPFRKQVTPVFSRVSGDEKVGAWTTDYYEGRADGEKVAAAWVAGWNQLGVGPADLRVLDAMADFFGGITGLLPDFRADGLRSLGIEGFPVRMTGYGQGRETEMEIGAIERREFAPALFEIPAGYERKPLELPRF